LFEPDIVDELLTGVNDWRHVPDIVKLTFKALSDVVRVQGATLAEVQKTLNNKASKAEVQAMYKTVSAETVRALSDNRKATDDLLEFKADRGALMGRNFESSEAPSAELRKLMRDLYELKSDINDIKAELRLNEAEQVKLKSYLGRLDDSGEQTDLKSFKGSFTTALHRKANKQEVEAMKLELELTLEGKADKLDMQNAQLALEMKADKVLLENLASELRHKPDKDSIDKFIKTEFSRLERGIEYRTESSHGLDQRWASVAVEIDQFMNQVKADLDRLEKLTKAELVKKADSRELDRLSQLLARKVDGEALDLLGIQLRGELKQASADDTRKSTVKLVKEQTETLQRSEEKFQKFEDDMKVVRDRIKRDAQRTKTEIDDAFKVISQHQNTAKNDILTEVTRVKGEIDRLSKQVKELKSSDSKKLLEKKLQSKADVTVVTEALFSVQKDTAENLSELKAEFKRMLALSEKEILVSIERKANISDVRDWLTSKVDLETLELSLEKLEAPKFDAREFVARAEFMKYTEMTSKTFADLNKELMLRCTIKDVCALLDTKASVDEVSSDIRELKALSSAKLDSEEFLTFRDDQVQLNELVYAESCVIRLIWSSGLVRKDGRIVWDALNFNSCPENFEWQDDIVAHTPGLYQIYWCFFTREVEEVVLCVNGQEVCKVTETPTKRVPSQWMGKICGSSFSDYISLPPKAYISLMYRGDPTVEGFVGLKKL